MSNLPGSRPPQIDEALKNAKVLALFNAISAQTNVTFVEVEQEGWSCYSTGTGTIIEVTRTKHPAEALAHELLHAEMSLAGFRKYETIAALVPAQRRRILFDVLAMLDNELQHHRMFHRFADLGLSGRRF